MHSDVVLVLTHVSTLDFVGPSRQWYVVKIARMETIMWGSVKLFILFLCNFLIRLVVPGVLHMRRRTSLKTKRTVTFTLTLTLRFQPTRTTHTKNMKSKWGEPKNERKNNLKHANIFIINAIHAEVAMSARFNIKILNFCAGNPIAARRCLFFCFFLFFLIEWMCIFDRRRASLSISNAANTRRKGNS